VLAATANAQLKRLMQPSGIFVAYYNKRPIPETVSDSVMGFFFLFIASFAVLAGLLGFFGLDFVTAVSGAASAMANVGPGLGDVIGPAGTYAFTVLVLLSRNFWRG
jgi:trk system potassium uptake protein TrkH